MFERISFAALCMAMVGSLAGCSPASSTHEGNAANGGVSNGGVSNGGVSNGGASNGGVSNGGVSNGGVSNGGVSNGGVGTTGIAGAPSWAGSANANCSPWPRARLFPTVGPFFYGPNPGPCTMTVSGLVHTFSYDASGHVTRQSAADGSEVITYEYDQDLLVSETSSASSGATLTTYQYVANTVAYGSSSASGTRTDITYTLDSMGYPLTTLIISPAPTTGAHHYSYQYDNCRLARRVAYNASNAEVPSQLTEYSYDGLGRLSHRTTPNRDEIYDYSCW